MSEYITIFQELDRLGVEYPEQFQHQAALQQLQLSGLQDRVFKEFNYQPQEGEIVGWPVIQDATFFAQFIVRHWNIEQPQARLDIRMSNFGNLVCIAALDDTEPDEAIEQVINHICQACGYQYVPIHALYASWVDCRGQQTQAWRRFFNYV